MEFILLLTISFIPLIISFSVTFFSKSNLTKALSLFLCMLSFWQIDIAILYAHEILSIKWIDILFRFFRVGTIFIMPIMYYFTYFLVQENKELKRFKLIINKFGLFLVSGFSIFVYVVNYTNYGIVSYQFIEEKFISPDHWLPVYGSLSILFKINVLFVFINTFILILATVKIDDRYYKSFYFKLAIAAFIIFINGVMSGFSFIPLFFSSFNSISATVILFLGFFQMQSYRISSINTELIRQSDLLEAIMDINPNYLLVKNGLNKIVKVNQSFARLLDIPADKMLGKDLTMLSGKSDMLETVTDEPYRYVDSRGATNYILWGRKELLQNTGEIYKIYFGIDVTEQKRNEQLQLSSEKLKVVGEMAASVAHEIRNPLTTIRGFIQLLKENKNESTGYENILLEEIDRINQVLKQLLILGKPEAKQNEENTVLSVLLFEEIQNIKLLFQALAIEQNKHILVENRLKKTTVVKIDKSHFKQILINVIKNSFEAIPSEKGTIKIILDEKNSKCRIRIIDNGEGINKERLIRIGEPYYTSKEKGTGIGLTICFKLLKENNGKMKVQSKEGWGTAVTILLPKVD